MENPLFGCPIYTREYTSQGFLLRFSSETLYCFQSLSPYPFVYQGLPLVGSQFLNC